MEKLRVGIVFGGKSAEHEVSLQSAKNIVDAIDKSRFDVVLLGIDKQGQWHVSDASNYLLNADDPAHIALRPSATSLAQVPGKHEHQLIDAQNGQPLPTVDVIFPIVHGTLGEDGSLQGMLRVANLPFVGSDVLASAACMDKDVTKRLISLNGNRPDLIVDLWCNGCRNYHFRAIFVNVLGVVGIEIAGEYDLATGAGLRIVVAQNCAFDLTTFDPLLNDHFMIELERQIDGNCVLFFTGYFADTNRRALISRFYKQW